MAKKPPPVEPTREELIGLCERGIVPQEKWSNRDSGSAQKQLGENLVLLMAGCEYRFRHDMGPHDGPDPNTHWIEILYRGFDWFEGDLDGGQTLDEELGYIPSAARLDRAAGGDWY